MHAMSFVFIFHLKLFFVENFPVDPFAKISNLSKTCNFDNSYKYPRKIGKYFPCAMSNLRENSFTHLKHFLTFLLLHFIEK